MLQSTTLTGPVRPLEISPSGAVQDKTSGAEFANLLSDALSRVEAAGSEAGHAVDSFLAGGPEDLHSVALAGQKAALQFEMLLQVRNKIVQAYQEVMRMQL
jgi:flagellar hook-basal body complex protein FliE